MANDILRAAEKYGRLRKRQFAVGPRSALCSGLGQVARVRLSTLFEANVSTFLAVSTPHGHRTILAAKAGMMPIDAGEKPVEYIKIKMEVVLITSLSTGAPATRTV